MYQGSAKTLGIGLFVTCCLALLLLYRREQRSASPRSVPQAAIEARNPTPVSSLGTYIREPEKSQLSTAAAREAKTIAVDSVSSQPAAETRPPAESTNAVISTAPLVNAAQPDTLHRPHISAWPEGAFSYPIAPSRNLTGTVLLKAVIGMNGAVTSVDILSGNRSLASAAAEAVWQWRYSPQKVNGIPTEAETNIVIDFRGDDAVSVSFPAR
jgi:TonB family protein